MSTTSLQAPSPITMTFDEILEQIGDFGPYQKVTFYLLCTPAIMKAAILMSAVFVTQLPEFRCAIPGLANDTFLEQGDHHRYLINRSIPSAGPDDDESTQGSSQCYLYANSTVDSLGLGNLSTGMRGGNWTHAMSKCSSWVYDRSEVHTSILTEFNFVCDGKVMRSHANMGFFGGSLVGAVVMGSIADVIGRKKALLLCIGIQVVCGTSLYFIPSMVAVVVVRSLQGMATEMFAISASTAMELIGPSKRTFAGVVVQLFWCGGQLVVVLVAYVSKDWRVSELVYALSAAVIFVLACLPPESPRWLIDKQRFSDAEKILKRIAKSNKSTLPEDIFKVKADETSKPDVKVWKLLSNRTVLVTSAVVFFNWFGVNFLYNGLSLNLDNLSGSLYVNFMVSLAVETLGYFLCLALLDRTGRKRLYVMCMFLGGVACLAVNFPVVFGNEDHQWIVTTLAMLGKMMSSSCYCIVYIMTVEIFPTVVRNSALGVCLMFENVAGMVVPYIADLGILVNGSLSKALPTTVFGSVTLLAAVLSLLLPETLHQHLPETVEDIEKLFRGTKPPETCHPVTEEQSQHFDSRL